MTYTPKSKRTKTKDFPKSLEELAEEGKKPPKHEETRRWKSTPKKGKLGSK